MSLFFCCQGGSSRRAGRVASIMGQLSKSAPTWRAGHTKRLALSFALWVSIGPAFAQEARSTASDRPFEITDNSFLVEEAFNQEPGIFQNIATFRLDGRDEWETTFTQEWPVFSQAHQLAW